MSQVSLADLSAQGAVLVQETKAIARDVFIATQKSRDGVIGTQRLADVDNLQLENLRYEKGYLLRDIQRCRNFRCVGSPQCSAIFMLLWPIAVVCGAPCYHSTVETDKIALVPVEEFLTSAPPHLTAVSEAENPHKFFMNRLAHELEMRKKCVCSRCGRGDGRVLRLECGVSAVVQVQHRAGRDGRQATCRRRQHRRAKVVS